jgi:hypothetical protein
MEACTVFRFVSINAKFGIFTVMRLNGTLVEARIRILKVLSSEMDPAESSTELYKSKRCGGFLEKSARPPSSESPLTQGRHLVQ